MSIINEADWPRMAKFHAKWSDKICSAMLEYLLSEEEKRFNAIIAIFREWVQSKEDTHIDIVRCNRIYTRFTTDGITAILPDIPEAPSGWNTDNHYFYEIINRNSKISYIQFTISSKNITDDFRTVCDEINKHYPAKTGKEDWQWRCPFKTSSFELGEQPDRDEIIKKLEECLSEIHAFEDDLKSKIFG